MSVENHGTLLGPAKIRQLAAEFGIRPTKKLGQNFVHDPNTVRKIIRAAQVTAADCVLEIGPGLGSLTLGLCETGAKVVAVEIDAALAKKLPETVAQLQPDAKLEVINSDALQVKSLDLPVNILVANLPYNVSVPIIMHLFETFPTLQKALVMVQLEVGERLAAKSGSKVYGAPSAKAAWYGSWNLAGKVSRQIFWPVPGVDSVLVECVKYPQPLGSETERKLTFELINSAFAQRRKMLRQSLQKFVATKQAAAVAEVLDAAGVAASARAEDLTVSQFLAIARVLLALEQKHSLQ